MTADSDPNRSQPNIEHPTDDIYPPIIFEDDDLIVRQYIPTGNNPCNEEWHMFGAFGDTEPFGYRLAIYRSATATFYVPKKNVWYQTSDMHKIIAKAVLKLRRLSHTNIINYGSSMGGFAACAFAKFTEAKLVIAAAPQISIDPSLVGENDKRWNDIGSSLAHQFPDAREGVSEFARIVVLYDPHVIEDAWHVHKLQASAKVELLPFEFAGHAVLHTLKDAGILRPLIESVAGKKNLSSYFETYNEIVKQTFGYWHSLAHLHIGQREWDQAEHCLLTALSRPGPTDQVYSALAEIMHERGLYGEAARYALQAVEAAPKLAGLYVKAAQALDKAGDTVKAEALLKKCLSTLKDGSDACSVLADFAFRRGDTIGAIEYMKRANIGRMGLTPWHTVLGELYRIYGDRARSRQQFHLAQQPPEPLKAVPPPFVPMYQDSIAPVKLGVRAEKWSKTLLFSFLELDSASPCTGRWSLESSDMIIKEDFGEAFIVKEDFYNSLLDLKIYPGRSGYISIDLPAKFKKLKTLRVQITNINNACFSFIKNDEQQTPAFEIESDYLLSRNKICNFSIVACRINNNLPASLQITITTLDEKLATVRDALNVDNFLLMKRKGKGSNLSRKFYSNPETGISDAIRFLLHCEACSEDDLYEKLHGWAKLPAPKIKYMIFFMPRSGSTLLCQILAKSGIFGSAHELFMPANFHPLYRILDCANASEYIDRIEHSFQSAHGVFGAEIDWDRYQTYWRFYLEERLDGYIKFYLDRRDFLSHFISQFYATVADIWFDVNGNTQPERDVSDQLTDENVAKVFGFLLRQKLSWSKYLEGRTDVRRIYFEDIMSKTGLEEIFCDILPDATLWPRILKEWKNYYNDTFFVPGSPQGKRELSGEITKKLHSSSMTRRSTGTYDVFYPAFLSEFADDIVEATERGISLAPFVCRELGPMWIYNS